jgi:uncharacterized membrane protein
LTAARGDAAPGDPPHAELASQNIDAVLDFYAREEKRITRPQRALERISHLLGRPAFLGGILGFVTLWILANLGLVRLGYRGFDAAPFSWLQGIIGLSALLTATIVLTRQNRLAGLAEQRDHLDLKVTLLTEQKVAKLIHLVEELRRDLPNVHNRHDADALAMQVSMNPDKVLATLDEVKAAQERQRAAPPEA